MMDQDILTITNMSFNFINSPGNTDLRVLDNISLTMAQGEFISIVGPSGCGKTTLLNIIAGFIHGYDGQFSYLGQSITSPSPERAVVFQSAVLFPWLTVYGNIAYGLKQAGLKKAAINEIVKDYLGLVQMVGFEDYYPEQLSGGMQQRVALARVLALQPKILLMDEPFAGLDAQTRLNMQELLIDITKKQSASVVFVTHDVEEAIYLSNRVYVMSKRPGKVIKQIKVPFTGIRHLSLRNTKPFITLKADIWDLLVPSSQGIPARQLKLVSK